MSTASGTRPKRRASEPPTLHNGDRLTQPEFHRRYEAYPEDAKFELIGGTVYMGSPLGETHSDYEDELGFVFGVIGGQRQVSRRFTERQPSWERRANPSRILGFGSWKSMGVGPG